MVKGIYKYILLEAKKKKNMSYQEKKMHRFVFTIIQKAQYQLT